MKTLFRGTNDAHFNHKKNLGYYYGHRMFNDYTTSVSTDLIDALIAGANRADTVYYQQSNAKPLLIAIDPSNYKPEDGLEATEIEIHGQISFKDITVINSLEDLLKACPDAKQEEIDFFKKHYLNQK